VAKIHVGVSIRTQIVAKWGQKFVPVILQLRSDGSFRPPTSALPLRFFSVPNPLLASSSKSIHRIG
jgi:hypothetical protein